ncbi:MAG: nucleotidyltransferase domain-containing protein, partial [Tissierellia bacterium]|nr:nucleotidyltransferase domain-containing protein [Tissierellia bacterium]
MRYGLKGDTLESIADIFAKHQRIEKAILFGSRAKGNYRNGSDIDLALLGKGLDLQYINRIHLDIDELYLAYKLDLVIYSRIENNDLIDHID